MIGRRILAAAAVLTLVGCGQSAVEADPPGVASGFPLTVHNCGRDVVIDAPPQRAVSLNQGSTEILLSLGLADRMVGTATWTDPVRENLAEADATVPKLAVNKPALETVLDADPDFVSASFSGTLGPGGVADRDQFEDLGVPSYLAPSDCVGKVSANSDGMRTEPLTMDAIYGEIRDLARIFDVSERGDALIGELQQRMEASRMSADVDVAFWFSDIRAPYFGGCCGAPGVITDTVGARNIFVDTTEEWPQVSWEVIADRDPDVLVLADLSRRTIDGDALAAKIEFLESNPVTSRLTAVQAKRYVVVNGADLNPSIRTVDGAEKLAEGLRRFGFASEH
ncbi:ABC transporter substrate-binding protein [Mycolicibacterium diernhoferi]|uniref:ABC transporter substrate-binding protein n=1 Tax=Mycolicibacterium diernhoferi TaxID=1801 RepID=A0A1Q4HLD5_9MYCO|nr:ABC transporter substrate-binding protein [Mycolicibacterium diernhoferi]OJZ68348.1 ABC transporter substrate-binding protein [Mycolicibacterium diernhoferi]OPE55262.1 ABC transporter substrate-binding protein [Mycolicibacterium diernhoferi]PEG51332.1 ABC transporter substrate-binding protein [Mycolicibacterium diernhoferi]QYL21151.1 ABC transporter substrate-binding protein [Mycolicibacterium diernhoferi]